MASPHTHTETRSDERFVVWGERDLPRLEPLLHLPEEHLFAMQVVARVLPFRVNRHVVDHLIDWDSVPDDPIFQLTFPQPGMLQPNHFEQIAALLRAGKSRSEVELAARAIRTELYPHPGQQDTLNVPRLGDQRFLGLQHKYRETVLYFPRRGQSCHSYCTFCFRWAQFVHHDDLKISGGDPRELQVYLAAHPEVTDLLVTGGDPMIMKARHLEGLIAPLLEPEFEHIRTIRLGTKSLTFWPQRFTSDDDADELLRLFERVVAAGKSLAFMAHYNHWRELQPPVSREAIRRILATGAVIRTQAPLLAHINDDPDTWKRMWREQVDLGMVPYYMFVARDTGAKRYFAVPLERAWKVYRDATRSVSGLCRTARGPSMSAGPGKIEVLGIEETGGERVFALRFLQGRNPDWVQRPFYAKYDPEATWLDELVPAFGQKQFFFEEEYRAMSEDDAAWLSPQAATPSP